MSDIVQNALRYGTKNTKRSDPPNPHNGEIVSENTIGFDCSGYVCHVMIESGYRINYEPTGALLGSNAFTTVDSLKHIQPGDIILFDGHVGIVFEYDHTKYLGRFIHMSGNKAKGGNIKKSYFTSNDNEYMILFKQKKNKNENLIAPDGESISYGSSRAITAFRRINKDRYSSEVDLHINGSNPQATLKPLGIRVYSNYKLKTPDTKQAVAKKTSNIPATKQIKLKSIPQENEYIKLIKRIWANLPSS